MKQLNCVEVDIIRDKNKLATWPYSLCLYLFSGCLFILGVYHGCLQHAVSLAYSAGIYHGCLLHNFLDGCIPWTYYSLLQPRTKQVHIIRIMRLRYRHEYLNSTSEFRACISTILPYAALWKKYLLLNSLDLVAWSSNYNCDFGC
jgi:hypothetical protein